LEVQVSKYEGAGGAHEHLYHRNAKHLEVLEDNLPGLGMYSEVQHSPSFTKTMGSILSTKGK
jgi:hypothetical protein